MKIKKLILTCFLIVLFASCRKDETYKKFLTDDTSLAKVLVAGKLRVGVHPGFPPLCFSGSKGNLEGFDLDILSAVTDYMGIEIEFIKIDWGDKFDLLNDDKIDCVASGFSITPEREKVYELTKPYFKNAQVIVVRADETIKTLEDLNGKIIGGQSGTFGMDIVDKYLKNNVGKIKQYSEQTHILSDLKTRGIDACITDLCVIAYVMQQEPDTYRILEMCLASDSYVYAFKKGAVSLKREIETVLIELDKTDVLEKISRKWFGANGIIIGR